MEEESMQFTLIFKFVFRKQIIQLISKGLCFDIKQSELSTKTKVIKNQMTMLDNLRERVFPFRIF